MEGTMTEFEENVSFDADDPDFAPKVTHIVVAQTVLRSVHFTDITFGVDKLSPACRKKRLIGVESWTDNPISQKSNCYGNFKKENRTESLISFVKSKEKNIYLDVATYQNMSVTSVQPASESLSRHGSNVSLSCHSLCDSVDDGLQGSHPQYQDTILTIEELRAQLNSCFTCGVSWSEEHVSLDCSECGGYSLQRPCPLCDGRCHTAWKRDLTMSHASGKARWIGECALSCGPSLEESLVPALEKLRATS
ncbi:protein pinocchio isoform X3 [Vespula squamosa]|uniref:Protein pinocchio isoform X3 n=1 Tax=Vespula squamosa TaxID=30214 RepID=A0ABD1ZUI4_VESSQ